MTFEEEYSAYQDYLRECVKNREVALNYLSWVKWLRRLCGESECNTSGI
jgi:hypothetical protein